MESLNILVDDRVNSDFIINLLRKFPFIIDISSKERNIDFIKENEYSPFRKIKGKPSIDELAGIWADKPKNIHSLREKAWKRK